MLVNKCFGTDEQWAKYEIGLEGDDIHWDEIDEDIHISSFFESVEPNIDNPIADIFNRFPQLNVSEVARTIGINKSLLSRYIYGIKKPSQQRTEQNKFGTYLSRPGSQGCDIKEYLILQFTEIKVANYSSNTSC